jgi:hypothetical protein
MSNGYDINSEREKIKKVCKDSEQSEGDDLKIYYVLRTLPLPLRKDLMCRIRSFPLDMPFDGKA